MVTGTLFIPAIRMECRLPNNMIKKYFFLVPAFLGLWNHVYGIEITSLYPRNQATNQCIDTPLRAILSGPATLNWSGEVRITNLNTGTVIHRWNLNQNPPNPLEGAVAANWPYKDSVGHTQRNVWPLVIDSIPDNLVEIRVPHNLLKPGVRYQIEMEPGTIQGKDGSSFSGISSGEWTFSTRLQLPTPSSSITVAQDNSADVCSIQGGLDLIEEDNSGPSYLWIKSGYYREMAAQKGKNNIYLYGTGANQSFIRYYNSNHLNEGTSYRNVLHLEGNEIHIRALSLTNTVTVTGSQAEALFLVSDKAVVTDVIINSHQDSWHNKNGRVYVENSTINGSVDFIWGYSPAFFNNCILGFTRKSSVVVMPRNDASTHGYVFNQCILKALRPEYTDNKFARDAGTNYPDGEVVWLNTQIEGNIMASSPWTINSGMDVNRLNFCEYKSTDANGNLIIPQGQRQSHQCSDALAESYSKAENVLDGWTPEFLPIEDVLSNHPGLKPISIGRPKRDLKKQKSFGGKILDVKGKVVSGKNNDPGSLPPGYFFKPNKP